AVDARINLIRAHVGDRGDAPTQPIGDLLERNVPRHRLLETPPRQPCHRDSEIFRQRSARENVPPTLLLKDEADLLATQVIRFVQLLDQSTLRMNRVRDAPMLLACESKQHARREIAPRKLIRNRAEELLDELNLHVVRGNRGRKK